MSDRRDYNCVQGEGRDLIEGDGDWQGRGGCSDILSLHIQNLDVPEGAGDDRADHVDRDVLAIGGPVVPSQPGIERLRDGNV